MGGLATHRETPPLRLIGCLLLLVALVGCAGSEKRPVFYPNAYTIAVGKEQSEQDIRQCMELARDWGIAEKRDGEVGQKAATGALLGGVSSGVWGLIRGDAGELALAGALAGGSVGGIKGAVDSREFNPTFKRFVERCLSDRGYDVIGWE
ncbi:MAG: glycine zipper family protein [Gammaproteobacteria bacterium]|nr:glycine zipper family protein [Gammaproteobacteria bacterium]